MLEPTLEHHIRARALKIKFKEFIEILGERLTNEQVAIHRNIFDFRQIF